MSEFNADVRENADGVLIVKFAGILDVFTLADFMGEFKRSCGNPKVTLVAVDLGEVEYIASSGWSVLLSCRRALTMHGGEMSIFGLHDGIRRVYENMNIETLLPVVVSLEAVRMSLKAGVKPAPAATEEYPTDIAA